MVLVSDIVDKKDQHGLFFQCTPVGSRLSSLDKESPLDKDEAKSTEILDALSSPDGILFDVNYDPQQSLLMRQWNRIRPSSAMNGLQMNRLQAVIAFSEVMKRVQWLGREEVSRQIISDIMRSCP